MFTLGWTFILGIAIGYCIFEFGHWGVTGHFFWFRRSLPEQAGELRGTRESRYTPTS